MYDSRVFDAGGPAYGGTLEWVGSWTEDTAVLLQLRSGETSDGLANAEWRGPSEAAGHYKRSGIAIAPAHAGHRYWQYRAILTRDVPVVGPVLGSVTIRYRRLNG